MALSTEKREKNRNTLGARLKEMREAQGFTQNALAKALGLEYYTMISQMELGYVSIPPAFWAPIADILGQKRDEWVLTCLDEINPEIYQALFGMLSKDEVARGLSSLRKGKFGS